MATSKSFAICVKISAADYISEEAVNTTFSRTETSALGHLLEMASWGLLDIIEISGGDYENPGKHIRPVYMHVVELSSCLSRIYDVDVEVFPSGFLC